MYYLEDIGNALTADPTMNVLAFALTPLHAVGISATIESLTMSGEKLSGYVIMVPHPKTGMALKVDDFSFTATNVHIIQGYTKYREWRTKYEKIRERLLALHESKIVREHPIYLIGPEIYPWFYNFVDHKELNSYVKPIVIDDGVGAYDGTLFRRLSSTKYLTQKSSRIKRVISYGAVLLDALFSIQIEKNATKSGTFTNNRMFFTLKNRDGIKWIPNQAIVPFYRSVFETIGHCAENSKTQCLQDSILINSQCLAECGMTDGKVDLHLYQYVVRGLERYGKTIVVKPHPREEKVEKYSQIGCVVFQDNSLSQESILASLDYKPVCIISIHSSTLLNAICLYEIPAISLAKLMLNEDISKQFRMELERYIDRYKSIIRFPSSVEELCDIVKRCIDNER